MEGFETWIIHVNVGIREHKIVHAELTPLQAGNGEPAAVTKTVTSTVTTTTTTTTTSTTTTDTQSTTSQTSDSSSPVSLGTLMIAAGIAVAGIAIALGLRRRSYKTQNKE